MSGALAKASATLVSGHRLDQEVDAVGLLGLHLRFGKVRAVETAFAMDMLGRDETAPEGLGATRIDRDLRPAGQFDKPQRVPGRQIEWNIAGDRDDAEKLDLVRRGEGGQDRDRVVLAGIGVEDDFLCHGLAFIEKRFVGGVGLPAYGPQPRALPSRSGFGGPPGVFVFVVPFDCAFCVPPIGFNRTAHPVPGLCLNSK